jgi:PAS domain S-box-containing protein
MAVYFDGEAPTPQVRRPDGSDTHVSMIQQLEPGDAQPLHPGLEALDDAFCMLDPGWRVSYWNRSAEQMFALGRAAALGRTLWELIPHLRGSVSWDALHRVRREGTALRFLDLRPAAGPAGFLSIYASPAADGSLAVQFRDATEEVRRAEQFSALLESIRDGFVAVDAEWRIVYINAVGESLLRFARDRAIGMPLWSLLPRGPAEIGEALRATMADGIRRHLREVRPEGRVFRGRVYDLWVYPLVGGGLSVLFEDVSERVQREKELARLATEAQEANRAKSRFFAAISHELRTPLNAIVGYTHLLNTQTYGPMPNGALRAADRAGVCAEHLSRLVDDVLLLTTVEIGKLTVFPGEVLLQEYLPSIVEPFRHQAEAKGLRFVLDLPDDLPPIETDSQRLRQMLVGLLSNAVKFTSRGEVGLRAALQPAGGPLAADAELEIRVHDCGPGIGQEDRERIFGPFEQLGDPARTDSMNRGSGLGLTIARQLAGLLRGDLHLAETSERGSVFRVRLPLRFPRSAS